MVPRQMVHTDGRMRLKQPSIELYQNFSLYHIRVHLHIPIPHRNFNR